LPGIWAWTSSKPRIAEFWGEDFARRIRLSGEALETHDFIHVHTKGPDEAGHAKDPLEKVRVIEELDLAIAEIFPLLERRSDLVVVVTADHSTPSSGPLWSIPGNRCR
jgi:2,3-bisphosphoglycerate-independent phosphoglycerate mutase